jgi:hypothetical protein
MTDEVQRARDMLHRAGSCALRAKAALNNYQHDFERGVDQANLYICDAEALLRRARAALIRDPALRADALADAPKEPDV